MGSCSSVSESNGQPIAANPAPVSDLGNPFKDQEQTQMHISQPPQQSQPHGITVNANPPPQQQPQFVAQPQPQQNVVQEQVYVPPPQTQQVEVAQPQAENNEPDVPEEWIYGEVTDGVTYWLSPTTKKVRSINVSAGECKKNIPGIEARIKSDNSVLKHIRVGFDPSETENIDYFLSGIFATANYKEVQVSFENVSMFTPNAFVEFGKSLAKLQLNKFFVESWGGDFHDGVLEGVKSGLVSQKNLKALEVMLFEGKITDAGVKSLCDASQGLNNLEEFVLLVEKAGDISDSSLTLIKQALSKKPKVTRLELVFNSTSKVTQTGLNEIRDLVQSLPTLKTVVVELQRGSVAPEAISALSQALQGLGIPTCTVK